MKRFTTARRSFAAALLTALAGLPREALADGEPTSTRSVPQAKPYMLYLGSDLSLLYKGAFYPIVDVKNAAFVIHAEGQFVSIPMRANTAQLKFAQSMKLATSAATIDKLEYERAYTPGNDPALKFRQMQEVQDATSSQATITRGNTTDLTHRLDIVSPGSSTAGPNTESGAMVAKSNGIAAAAESLQDMIQSQDNSSDALGGAMGDDLFDAINASFSVSSAVPLRNPFIVAIVRYHDPRSKQGISRNWIYSIALDPVEMRPKKYDIKGSGFPQGYVIENFQLHLYNGGQEIATNTAPKHMALSRDSAFAYMTFEYLSAHKGATLAASPSKGDLPGEIRARLSDVELNRLYYVRVKKDGVADGVFLDEACGQRANEPAVEAVVKVIHFNPALDKGAAVEGVAMLKLGQVLI
jgi:hypothetical protein